MNKFEVVSAYADKGINIPTRATHAAAGYDFEVAEDITVPSWDNLMSKWARKELLSLPELTNTGLTRDEIIYKLENTPRTLAEIAEKTKELKIKPTLVPTGIKCQLANDCYLELSVRSSTPLKHWLILANGVGIIDGDYYNNPDNEGHIYFQLINLSPFDIQLKKGDKIGQGIIKKYEVTDDDYKYEKKERAGGFGSTSVAIPMRREIPIYEDAVQLTMDDFLQDATRTDAAVETLDKQIDITGLKEISEKVQRIQENLYKQLQGTMIHG